MKTIDEVKQEVAEEYGYKSNSVFSAYEQIVINPHYISHDNLINIYDEVTIRYASQFEDRIKELEDELGVYKIERTDLYDYDTKLTIEFKRDLSELLNRYDAVLESESLIEEEFMPAIREFIYNMKWLLYLVVKEVREERPKITECYT